MEQILTWDLVEHLFPEASAAWDRDVRAQFAPRLTAINGLLDANDPRCRILHGVTAAFCLCRAWRDGVDGWRWVARRCHPPAWWPRRDVMPLPDLPLRPSMYLDDTAEREWSRFRIATSRALTSGIANALAALRIAPV